MSIAAKDANGNALNLASTTTGAGEVPGSTPVDPASGTPFKASSETTLEAVRALLAAAVAIAGKNAPFAPGYSGPDTTGNSTLSIDPDGAAIVRASALTDEGTFRLNFANTSLAVSIGNVTVSGAVVTGTGFLTADVHKNDYFKVAADADSAYVQIDSIDSDTQMTLVAAYIGSASGVGNRALMKPVIGSGGSIAVASGQATIGSGTTIAASTGIVRLVDYAPLVYRARFSLSQRIANQAWLPGLREDAATPRWFARFRFDGTTNTTAICETGRNPTGAPSASETETTTFTIPDGLTSAAFLDTRIEQLTESVRFYCGGVLVAEHTKVIPHQHDEMAAVAEWVNSGSAPASNTNAMLDYCTGKNHNKLEIGVMSDGEKIVAAAPPTVSRSFTQAGVIAINTDLLVIDCRQARTVSLQAVSIGTTGRLDFFLTNDLTQVGTAQPAYPIGGGAGVTTTTAAGMWNIPTNGAAFLRVRLGVATTAGTTTLAASVSQTAHPIPAPTTQPVSLATNTPTLAAGTNRAAFVAGAGIWYDDSSTTLAANATFTGTSRDATVTATATAMANAATYAQEVRLSAESDVTGTLWLEVSRDNTNWRRVKSVATAAVTGGGFYAEIVHRPSWRYWRCGYTNGATIQTRFSINSLAMAA